MGLAASQARLLTITSRLSSVELRQQRIAMDKMRLANDSEAVSTKYTEALNNKTLSFSNGSDNNIPLTYSLLEEQGYSVQRASDGLSPKSLESYNKVVAKPTCPKPSEIKAPDMPPVSYDAVKSNYNATKAKEADNWRAKLNNITNSYGEYPSYHTVSNIEEIFKKSSGLTLTAWNGSHLQNQNDANKEFKTNNLWELINAQDDKLVRIGDDGDKRGVPVQQAQQNVQNIGDAIIKSIASGLGLKDVSGLKKSLQGFLDELKNNINGYQDKNKHYSEKKATNGAKDDAKKTIIGNGTDKGGTDHDFYFLNVSELARRLMAMALNSHAGQSISVGTKCDSEKVSLDTSNEYTMTYNSKGYSVEEWENLAKTTYDSASYKELAWNDAIDVAKGVAQDDLSGSGYVDPLKEKYEQEYKEYTRKLQESTTLWNEYEQSLIDKEELKDGKTPASVELYNQLKNSQFLIQGLLSGYLALVKDGQQVSLSSATSIIEEYDKSDDAAAEAEYNTQMSKINRKEKQLDMQAKRIDTEYSALQQEYESVKSIISNHAKDFYYFS